MNLIANVLAIAGDLPWWSILVFIDEPDCPKFLLKEI